VERPELNDDFVDLLRALAAAQVEFLIVGAHALAAHGIPRATGDLDVLVEPTPENARRVIEALGAFGAPIAAHGRTTSTRSVFPLEGSTCSRRSPASRSPKRERPVSSSTSKA
jgi:hypothetical protein